MNTDKSLSTSYSRRRALNRSRSRRTGSRSCERIEDGRQEFGRASAPEGDAQSRASRSARYGEFTRYGIQILSDRRRVLALLAPRRSAPSNPTCAPARPGTHSETYPNGNGYWCVGNRVVSRPAASKGRLGCGGRAPAVAPVLRSFAGRRPNSPATIGVSGMACGLVRSAPSDTAWSDLHVLSHHQAAPPNRSSISTALSDAELAERGVEAATSPTLDSGAFPAASACATRRQARQPFCS